MSAQLGLIACAFLCAAASIGAAATGGNDTAHGGSDAFGMYISAFLFQVGFAVFLALAIASP
jgi:hypothetical protein